MKTLKIISALLVMVSLTVTATVSAQRSSDLSGPVTYIVTVNQVDLGECPYVINVLDDHGAPVAHPQLFSPDILVYTFEEWGPINGNLRVVTLEKLEGTGCETTHFFFNPVKLTGPFVPGCKYAFKPLIPINMAGESADAIEIIDL
jgi:hypothetical protein